MGDKDVFNQRNRRKRKGIFRLFGNDRNRVHFERGTNFHDILTNKVFQ